MLTIEIEDLIKLFGASKNEFTTECWTILKECDFQYRRLDKVEKEREIGLIKSIITSTSFRRAGSTNISFWDDKLRGIYREIKLIGFKPAILIPDYLKDSVQTCICRLGYDYIVPQNHLFEYNLSRIYKNWLFNKYLSTVDAIYEFGAGSGQNVLLLAKMFPSKKILAYDWSPFSKMIINTFAKNNVSSGIFDMFRPDKKCKIKKNSAFLTFSSLEQLGTNFREFVDFAIKKKVSLFVSVEPVEELYDKEVPFDQIATAYIKKRNYLRGYLTYLKHLEKRGIIKILVARRIFFGNLFFDSSCVIWRPI